MTSFMIASALVVTVVMMGCLLATWVKTSASRKIRDWLLIGLYLTFAAGSFFCFTPLGAVLVSVFIGACLAADVFSRKEGASDADQQH